MKYPILYAKNETDFFSLGLGVMTNTLEASVTEERNGSFYFESKIIIDVVIYPQLENDQLIKVDAGHELKDQRFRIKRIVDNHNGTASIYAEHISYLSAELSLKPEVTVSGNGSTALTIWKSSLIGANSFVVDSDITTSNSTKWRIDKIQNARQALGGVEGSILEKWGGEYKFDNYHISLLSKRGTTADVLLAYGRNITDFEQERNIANTFNSVYPFAIYTDDKQQEHLITLSGYFVDSSNIASFPNRKAQTVDFSNEFEHDVVPTQDKLKSLAQKYITTNGIGVPSVSIKVSFVDLSKISDYENIAPLEQLNLCDEVHVVYPKLKVNTTAKVVRVVWNVLAESYDEIEIGEKRVSLSDKISEQTKFINEVKTGANAALVSANGKNTNFYGIFGQDGNGEPKATKVGDLWYKPNGDKSELYQWNGTVWSFIISNDWQEIFNAKLTEELTKAKVELDAALAEKDAALAELDEKIADELVVIDTSVNKAQADANTATTRANDAFTKASSNVIDLQAAKIDIAKALNDSTSALNAIKVVDGRVDSVTTTIANVKVGVDKKADKTTVASQISQSATQVKQDVQSWTDGQLTNYSTIQSTATSIASAVAGKADKSQVTQLSDQITSVVSQRETLQSNLIQNAGLKNNWDYWTDVAPGAWSVSIHPTFRWGNLKKVSDMSARHMTVDLISPVSLDQTLTFVIRCKANSNKDIFVQLQATKGQSINNFFRIPVTTSMKTIKVELEATGGELANNIAFSSSDLDLNDILEIEYMKLVRGKTEDLSYYQASTDIASQSQITQLATDINLRVSKGDIVNQINISPESILIAGNKIQITGQTYIENGVIENAKIKDLSASKLTAGTIDASLINVTKINASNITTGILNADRIAANSITATHISISSLSALSANLGVITAGTINAATVNIININAGSITTGTLSADRIGANSITADKIKATSLDLFSNDSYTNVSPDGMRIQGKAQIVFTNWRDSNGNLRKTEGVYIGGVNSGTKHVAFTRSDGSTFMLRANSDMDSGSNTNVSKNALNIYDYTHIWNSMRVRGTGLVLDGYIAMGGGIQESSIQYDNSAGTMNFRVPGGRSGSYFWFNQRAISEGSFDSKSKLSLKNVKGRYEGNALREIVNTDIAEYSYKNDPKRRQLSPIIDDINEIKKYHLPDIINDGESVNLYAMGSLSWLAIKQLAQKLENIEEKLDAIA
ncbi:phage tail spike protein [Lactococcus raffinolactis]|uniref:phage tail spike protein n=1 Tax=Pseudolactococcus raffinolactis TaxID=1366 RepID=UPI00288E3DEB|nr:phage tail spike protein [Lactococcus raffinolactis]MDT2766549.1 phage tail spike protein [Lactococcus raffinolactis]MDT2789709.1 phage tail spike protein [Lactococcus raffinolactis]